jgi:solute:Na+ symporter, SSS family
MIVMILAVLWSTQGGRFTSIFEAINAIAADLAPPITTVFLFGVFWRRGTKQASIITMITGFVIGAASFVLDLPVFGTEKLVTQGLGISFMMQAWWVFCICSVLFVVVSLLTPAPAAEQIDGLTWEHPFAVIFGKKVEAISDPRIIAGLLLVTMAVLYYMFR